MFLAFIIHSLIKQQYSDCFFFLMNDSNISKENDILYISINYTVLGNGVHEKNALIRKVAPIFDLLTVTEISGIIYKVN